MATRARWKAFEVGLTVENLIDARWRETEFNYVSNFRGPDAPASLLATRHFSAGAPRTWWLAVTFREAADEGRPAHNSSSKD